MSDLLDEYERKTGHSVPIHGALNNIFSFRLYLVFLVVDAASGGFIAPFATVSVELSINARVLSIIIQ